MRVWLGSLVLSIVLSVPLAAQTVAEPAPVSKRVGLIENWLRALVEHGPGTVDPPLTAFGELSDGQLQTLSYGLQAFIQLARDPGRSTFALPAPGRGRDSIQVSFSKFESRRLTTLACVVGFLVENRSCWKAMQEFDAPLRVLFLRSEEARARGDRNYTLRLGALFQAELAMWGRTQDMRPIGVPQQSRDRLFLDTTDGRAGVMSLAGLQWLLAYALLDEVMPAGASRPDPSHDPWSRDWYVATSHWMQSTGRWDELHIKVALSRFPTDAELRFLSGCLHEIDAGPMVQNAMRSVRAPIGADSDVTSAKTELTDAAADFRLALRARPDFTEARLRLGRVLMALEKWNDAAIELRAVLAASTDDFTTYYAALFLGNVEEQAGRRTEAAALYAKASDVFPTAQSPRLALSQLARRNGDRAAALAALQDLFAVDPRASGDFRGDPWWSYLRIQARDADERLQALRASLILTGQHQ